MTQAFQIIFQSILASFYPNLAILYVNLETIDQLFLHDKRTLAEYNWLDCQRVVEIFAEANLLDFAVQRATMTGLAIDRLGGAVAAFDNLYLPRLHRRGYVAPNVDANPRYGLSSPGGCDYRRFWHIGSGVTGISQRSFSRKPRYRHW